MESECEAAVNWLDNNKMIVNPDKLQVILLDKRGCDNINNIELKIGTEKIKSTSSVKLLGVHIDNKSAGNQLCSNMTKVILSRSYRKSSFSQVSYTQILTTALLYGCSHIKSH